MAKTRSFLFSLLLLACAGLPASAGQVDAIKAVYQNKEYPAALRQLLPLAEAGDPEAQYITGFMFGHGQGTAADQSKALAWFHTAADQDYADAQFAIGLMYDDGRGVRQDYQNAMSWYLKAAEQGLARAQNNLGNLYNDGLGTPENYPRAHMWYALSRAAGDERAARNLELLEDVMTPGQIAEARILVQNWTAAHPPGMAGFVTISP